jgi:CBS domain-containing protein
MRLPIRLQERLDAHGEVRVVRRVFCPAGRCSRRTEECQRCVSFVRLEDSAVECVPGLVEGAPDVFPDPGLGGDICVGEAMGGYAVLLVPRAPLGAAVEALGRAPVASPTGIVVDDADRVLGVIERPDARRVVEAVAGELALPVAPIRESATLAAAVARMTKERRRALPVVDDAGRVVGLVTDIDALRWVARRSAPR